MKSSSKYNLNKISTSSISFVIWGARRGRREIQQWK